MATVKAANKPTAKPTPNRAAPGTTMNTKTMHSAAMTTYPTRRATARLTSRRRTDAASSFRVARTNSANAALLRILLNTEIPKTTPSRQRQPKAIYTTRISST